MTMTATPPHVVTPLHCKFCGRRVADVFGLKPTEKASPIGVSKHCKCGAWCFWPLEVAVVDVTES
jgi:hypothetical protein